jgi:hypothetical protein
MLLSFAKVMEKTKSIIKENRHGRHSGLDPESRGFVGKFWIPAFAGMTNIDCGFSITYAIINNP